MVAGTGAPAPGSIDPHVDVFGFHLATVDLRQSSDQHEAVVAELLATARLCPDYASLDETAKRTLLLQLLNDARPLRVMGATYSDWTRSELAIFEAARDMRAAVRRRPSATTSSATPKPSAICWKCCCCKKKWA
jgi:phosphoenolpyruvate carboxylase